jgi:hypothetical protein
MARLSAGPRKAPARMRMSDLQTPRTVRPHDRLEGHVPIAAALELTNEGTSRLRDASTFQ